MMSRQILSITLIFLISNLAFAESYRLNANYFIRSTPRFSDNARNRLGVLAAGSTFKVLEKVQRRDNSYAVRIQITDAAGNSNVRSASSQWIYMSGRNRFTSVSDDTPVATTEAATTAAGSANCPTCAAAAGSGVGNSSDIAYVTSAITDDANTAEDSEEGAVENDIVSGTTTGLPPRTPFTGPLGDQIERYSDSPEVTRMISWAMAHRGRSRGLCYRLVKEAMATRCGGNIVRNGRVRYRCVNLLATGGTRGPGNNLIPDWFPDERALSAKDTLKTKGFVNLLETEPYRTQLANRPEMAPKGAILVYSSGMTCGSRTSRRATTNLNLDCGHTEIKTAEPGHPGFVSDYYSERPITQGLSGPRYRLVGVMMKPGV